MIENNRRLLSLSNASVYLSEISDTPVFESDIIQLICDGEIQPFCRVKGLWGKESWLYCELELHRKLSDEELRENERLLTQSSEIEELVIGLDGVKIHTPRKQHQRSIDRDFREAIKLFPILQRNPKALFRRIPREYQGETVWLEGTYRIHVGAELREWLKALNNEELLFDIKDLVLLDKHENRYKVYSQREDSLYEYFRNYKSLRAAWVRLKKSNILIDAEHLEELYKTSKAKKTVKKSNPASKLSLRMKVASFYLASVTKEHVLATPTNGLWNELREAAEELSQNDNSIKPEVLFAEHLKENTILNEFGKFRKHGLDFPLRR